MLLFGMATMLIDANALCAFSVPTIDLRMFCVNLLVGLFFADPI
jgi:hypothetical protein